MCRRGPEDRGPARRNGHAGKKIYNAGSAARVIMPEKKSYRRDARVFTARAGRDVLHDIRGACRVCLPGRAPYKRQ